MDPAQQSNDDTENAAAANSADAKIAKVRGGVEVEVQFTSDGSAPERVFVRKIPLKQMSEYLLAIYDDAAAINFYCDKPVGWSETLTEESQLEILKKGQEINLPLFESWYPLNIDKARALKPALIQDMERKIMATLRPPGEGSRSMSTAPSSPSAPAKT